MKKRTNVVKLGAQGLRRIIRGVIKESFDQGKLILPARLTDIVYDEWDEKYEGSVMSGGAGKWDDQLAAATGEFEQRVEELLKEIEAKLLNGEYRPG